MDVLVEHVCILHSNIDIYFIFRIHAFVSYILYALIQLSHTHATSCINGSWIGVRNSADGAMHSKKRYNKLISCCMQAFHSSHACIYIYIYIHPYTYLYCNVSDL